MPDSGQDHTTDLVLWNPAFFGSKPDMIIKGGMIVASKMGDANASIPTTQPVCYQPMFAAHGKAKQEACLTFVSKAAFDAGIKDAYGLEKTLSRYTAVAISARRLWYGTTARRCLP